MKYYVYALNAEKDNRIYVGLTKDVKQRLKEHNSGKTFSTKGYRPWTLFYVEEVNSVSDARLREKKLKSGSGKDFLKQQLNRNRP